MLPLSNLSRLLFFGAFAFTWVMALLPKPPALPIDSYGDKFEHMLAFGTLTLLARMAFRRASDWLILERLSFVGALIEVFQAWPALHRDCDPRDWLADTLAIAAMLMLCRLVRMMAGIAARR